MTHVRYDAFGKIIDETNTGWSNRYKFTGREFDKDSGLQYNRARWYDPAVGRWLSPDPIGFEASDINLYRYAKNAPTVLTDPSGFDPPFFHPWPGATPPNTSPYDPFEIIALLLQGNPLAEKLLLHYMSGTGGLYTLDMAEAAGLGPYGLDIRRASSFKSTYAALKKQADHSGQASGEFLGSNIAGALANGTLGNFTVFYYGTLTVGCDGSWLFNGTMRFWDVYDFDAKYVFGKKATRSRNGELKTIYGSLFIRGESFPVNSVEIPASQQNGDRGVRWAGGKLYPPGNTDGKPFKE